MSCFTTYNPAMQPLVLQEDTAERESAERKRRQKLKQKARNKERTAKKRAAAAAQREASEREASSRREAEAKQQEVKADVERWAYAYWENWQAPAWCKALQSQLAWQNVAAETSSRRERQRRRVEGPAVDTGRELCCWIHMDKAAFSEVGFAHGRPMHVLAWQERSAQQRAEVATAGRWGSLTLGTKGHHAATLRRASPSAVHRKA